MVDLGGLVVKMWGRVLGERYRPLADCGEMSFFSLPTHIMPRTISATSLVSQSRPMQSTPVTVSAIPSLTARDAACVWHPYTQHFTASDPLTVVRGEGAWLVTESGDRYLDAISSWWVNIHGHAHPHIADGLARQARELEHVIFAGFTHRPAVEVAERILGYLPDNFSKVFFSDNGSTAVEIGLKMALQYYHNLGTPRRKVVAFEEAFHGETFGAMSVSGELSLNNAFHSHLFEVIRIPPPVSGHEAASAAALEAVLQTESVYAFLFEPLIQGAGGMRMYAPAALDALLGICKENNVLSIADEVMTGFYRTGTRFAIDQLYHQPDIICLSKGLTGGTLPLALTVCTEQIFNAFLSQDKYKTFFHGHSYTANPLGCAAALASFDLIDAPDFDDRIARIGHQHRAFAARLRPHPRVRAIRCCGTIVALEFETAEGTSYFNSLRDRLYEFFLSKGLLLRPLGNVIYVMPPYCVTAEELEQVYAAIAIALDEVV